MTTSQRWAFENQMSDTESALMPAKTLHAILMAGGLALTSQAFSGVEQPYVINDNISEETFRFSTSDISIITETEKKEARANLVRRLRALREKSIQEGTVLLSSDQISEELMIRRGE